MEDDQITRFWSKVDKKGPADCWHWVAGKRNWQGYGCFRLNGKIQSSHRVSWQFSYGSIPDGKHVCHTCDNPSCVNPNHLFLGTHSDNMQDKVGKGRGNSVRGEKQGLSKLISEDIRRIRESSIFGAKSKDLAKIYGVSKETINNIKARRTWAHVD